MQSWPDQGQNGADGHGSWEQEFSFGDPSGPFDPNQHWQQAVGEPSAFSHLSPQDASSANFFEQPHQSNAYLASSLHGSPPPQQAFHGHGSLPLGHQFSQPSQDVIDPAFSNMQHDLYGQPGKVNINDGLNHLAQARNHSHAHSPGFGQHEYPFAQQADEPFDSSASPFSQAQLMSQSARQQSHTPVPPFDSHPGGFPQDQIFSRPPLQSPVPQQQQPSTVHHQRQSPAQHQLQPAAATRPHQQPSPIQHAQQTYSPVSGFASPANGHQNPYQPNVQSQLNYQPAQQVYKQPVFAPQVAHAYQSQTQASPGQQFAQPVQQQVQANAGRSASGTPNMPHAVPYLPGSDGIIKPGTSESLANKRKRTTKSASVEAPAVESPIPTLDFTLDSFGRKVEDVDTLTAPVPSAEDVQLIHHFSKRSKAAQAKYPSIKGVPHLVFDGAIKLPAPKSYDKLAPLVALPARSGKSMVPETGYILPCEVQGRFTGQYRPSADKGGLDERRIEAKSLLDDFDRSMTILGKRRPKYTEYPHAFKEQLKSDEASKNKAEKKAKKEQEDVQPKPIRATIRPTDIVEAAAWDAIGFVHVESGITKTGPLIATRVQAAGDLFIKLRGEMNRSKLELEQATKDKEPDVELARIKQEADQKKEAFYKALDATIEHADDAVLDNLGGHQKLLLSLVNALISCIKATDFSGKLPKIVLELFTHFRMTKKISETTNFDTVLKRFGDKGDEEVKDLVSEISAKIKKLKAAELDTATGYTGTSAASRSKTLTKPAPDASSAKRGRDDDSDSRTVKKIAVESGSGSLSKKLAQPKSLSQAASKIASAKPAISSLLPGKSRPIAKPAVKADAGADNASAEDKAKAEAKKLVKPEGLKPVAAKTEVKPPVPKTSAPSTSSALSGIASLLDSINAPKPDVPVVKEAKESDSQETPEQTAKRLRKQARRKLRVTWKPEGQLVQVKIFQKDIGEDEGREVHMIRDAADDRSEGMVLKQRADVQEDDEDDDIPYQPWEEPTATDFSALPEDIRNKSFITRGGNVAFTTDEQQRIADRGQRELMAIYTDPDDIPPSPRSPPPEAADGSNAKIVQLPDDAKFAEIQVRWRDEQNMGPDQATYAAMRRLDEKNNPGTKLDSILGRLKPTAPIGAPQANSHIRPPPLPVHNSVPLVLGAAVEEQVLAWIASDRIQLWRDPNPIHGDLARSYDYANGTLRMVGGAVEMATRELAGQPYPAIAPPRWLSMDREQVREWWLGFNKELAVRQKRADEERAKAEAESNALRAAAGVHQTQGSQGDWSAYYAHQQAYAPYLALLQQMTGGQPQPGQPAATPAAPAATSQPPSSIPDTQLQSILAAINQPGQQGAPSAPAAGGFNINPNDPSYQQLLILQQMQGGQAAAQAQAPTHGGDNDWDSNNQDDAYRDRDGKDGRKKKATLPVHKPANKALIGTKPCTFWQQGKCARGDKCTFRHD